MIIKYINYIKPSNAEGLVADIYRQAKRWDTAGYLIMGKLYNRNKNK